MKKKVGILWDPSVLNCDCTLLVPQACQDGFSTSRSVCCRHMCQDVSSAKPQSLQDPVPIDSRLEDVVNRMFLRCLEDLAQGASGRRVMCICGLSLALLQGQPSSPSPSQPQHFFLPCCCTSSFMPIFKLWKEASAKLLPDTPSLKSF